MELQFNLASNKIILLGNLIYKKILVAVSRNLSDFAKPV